MAATGNDDALDPIVAAIHRLIDGVAPDAHEKRLMHEDTLALVLMAMGDAQLGGAMAEALGLPRDTARALATELITGRIATIWAEQEGKARSEEHTSELQSLMRISYAVFCLTKKKQK